MDGTKALRHTAFLIATAAGCSSPPVPANSTAKPAPLPDAAPARDAAPDPDEVDRAAEAARQEEAQRFADMLASDDLSAGIEGTCKPGADLGAQIDAVRASGAAVAVGSGVSSSRGVTIGSGSGSGSTTPAIALKIARVSMSPDDSTLPGAMIQKRIQDVYMAGLRRCYRDAGASDPSTLAFVVSSKGRVGNVQVTKVSTALASCITSSMVNWTFAVPRDDDYEPIDIDVRVDISPP